MYRDETKNLIDSLDWLKFNSISFEISASMYNEESCRVVAGTITATIDPSYLTRTAFIYFVNLEFSNNYQNGLGLSDSRKFEITIDDVTNDKNKVRYSAYPIGGIIDDSATYDGKVRVNVNMPFSRIDINSSTLMSPNILSNLKTWWILLPDKRYILN